MLMQPDKSIINFNHSTINFSAQEKDALLTGHLNGREVVIISDRTQCCVKTSLFCLPAILLFIGGMMWGVCSDPTISGCSQAIKSTGQTLTGIGITLAFCECSLLLFI